MGIKSLKAMSISGRYFTRGDFRLIKETISLFPKLSRTELSKTISENLSWRQSNGEPKHIACLKVLEKLESLGYIELPSLKENKNKGCRRQIRLTIDSNPERLIEGQIDKNETVLIKPVCNKEEGRLWNEYIERYHYLGHKTAFGCQQKYFIRFESGKLLGCLLYSSSAWSVKCRDEWIGWDRQARTQRLHLIINNSRFLIFPWIRIKNLASHALSLAVKRVSTDWHRRHKYRPVLIETFVDARFKGICYRAANWKYLGVTKGRGRMDRYNKHISSPKEVFVYPIAPSFRMELKGGIE